MSKQIHRAKRIESGQYKYRGYIIQCNGYWQPDDHCMSWEGYELDEDGEIEYVVAKGSRKKEIMKEINDLLDGRSR